MRKRKIAYASALGAVFFFISVAAVVTVAVVAYAAIADRTENSATIAWVMLGVIVLLAAVGTLIDLLRRKIMVDRPVKKILEVTDRIAAGDFSVRLEIVHSYGKYDEYDYIMENVNRLAEALAGTEVLHTDFITNVSHELKTPLAIIQNYATSLQKQNIDEAQRREYAKTLANASKRLSDLVTSILKLSKLENKGLISESESVNLTETLAERIIAYEDIIEEKNLRLECDLEENVTIVSVPGYLETVWNNLLTNAIKFTENGGTVGVSLKRKNGKATVCVWDTGCGMTAETGKHIFEKFYQGDTSHAGEGNGLGLSLVKKVIEKVGGTISVESELGKGSRFTVTLEAEA